MNVCLANIDYQRHMTDEGHQLQEGLRHAGWTLCGRGFDGLQDVRQILERYRPECVFVSDKRDFDPSKGAFRRDVMFQRLDELAKRPEVFKIAVVKDAHQANGTYHAHMLREVGASAVLVYYHERSVLAECPWLREYPLIRHYHTVDAEKFRAIPFRTQRNRVVLSGARDSGVYPLRERMAQAAERLGCGVIKHPGYGNRGCATYKFAAELSGYKTHIATASRYGFALRKIIESVALGVAPITDLPAYDILPEIDQALVRVDPQISVNAMRDKINESVATWNPEERRHYAEKAMAFYDWRAAGGRLDRGIEFMRRAAHPIESLTVTSVTGPAYA